MLKAWRRIQLEVEGSAILRSVKLQPLRFASILGTMGLFLVAPNVSSLAGTFSDSQANGLNTNCWLLSVTTPGLYSFDDTKGHFALAKTAMHNPGGLQNVALALELPKLGGMITGDFSTQVSFTNAVLPDTSGSARNQIQFELFFEDNSFFMLRRSTNPNMIDVYSSVNGYVGAFASTVTAGTFSFNRTALTLSGYFNGRLVYAESKSVALTNIVYVIQNHDTDDAISVDYEGFSFTAASILPSLLISSVTNPAALMWPSGFSNFVLEATFSLVPPVVWETVNNEASIAAGAISVTITNDKPTRFFRLQEATP